MITPEPRGEYDFNRLQDSLVASDEHGQRVAIFVDTRRAERNIIGIAVSLPNSTGTRCYGVEFGWLLDHLRTLEPNREAAES